MVKGKRLDNTTIKPSMCIFCGGATPATTVEHCPPRAMFQNKIWPEGFEFPACNECNNGSSDQDLIVATLARCGLDDKGDNDGRLLGMLKMFNKQHPELVRKMLPSPIEARRMNRELGITPAFGETHQDAAGVKVTEEISDAIYVFARKLAKAVYFRETGIIFPPEGKLALTWFTNAELVQYGNYRTLDIFEAAPGITPTLERNRKFLNDQFSYKYTTVSDANMFVLQATFSLSFGLVVIAGIDPTRLDAILDGRRKRNGNINPFQLL